jgi:hypothetical protein
MVHDTNQITRLLTHATDASHLGNAIHHVVANEFQHVYRIINYTYYFGPLRACRARVLNAFGLRASLAAFA